MDQFFVLPTVKAGNLPICSAGFYPSGILRYLVTANIATFALVMLSRVSAQSTEQRLAPCPLCHNISYLYIFFLEQTCYNTIVAANESPLLRAWLNWLNAPAQYLYNNVYIHENTVATTIMKAYPATVCVAHTTNTRFFFPGWRVYSFFLYIPATFIIYVLEC